MREVGRKKKNAFFVENEGAGLEISARPLANASVKPVGRVEISGYSSGLASRIFIFRKIKL